MQAQIRPAVPSDLDAIAAIEEAGMRYGWSRSQLAEEFGNSKSRILVARHKGQVAGHVVGWRIAGEVHILDVCVAPGSRRQGIGKQLVNALLKACGPGPALLEVRASNLPAITLYSRMGFEEVGRRPRYYSDGEDALLMTLERS